MVTEAADLLVFLALPPDTSPIGPRGGVKTWPTQAHRIRHEHHLVSTSRSHEHTIAHTHACEKHAPTPRGDMQTRDTCHKKLREAHNRRDQKKKAHQHVLPLTFFPNVWLKPNSAATDGTFVRDKVNVETTASLESNNTLPQQHH